MLLHNPSGTHIVVVSGACSHGTLVVGPIHHVASHFKVTLLEDSAKGMCVLNTCADVQRLHALSFELYAAINPSCLIK